MTFELLDRKRVCKSQNFFAGVFLSSQYKFTKELGLMGRNKKFSRHSSGIDEEVRKKKL